MLKKILKVLLTIILVLLIIVICVFGYLTVTEFSPDASEPAEVAAGADEMLEEGEELTILSWNIGYGGLGEASDFFMDGGENVRAADKDQVNENLAGIKKLLEKENPDMILLQEVDLDSTRTFGIDETESIFPTGGSFDTTFAKNFSVPFVPYPVPPIGHVESGLYTLSAYEIDRAERISLPCPFSWPIRIANLKRCLLVNYLPIEGSDRRLVLIDLHLEAYDSGEGKIAQTRQLSQFMDAEYRKGNYVIAGGDFNQVFPGTLAVYPNDHPDLWSVGALEPDNVPVGFNYVFDKSAPTCRLLNQPYDPEDKENTQYYVIDGFLISPNVDVVAVKTLDMHFKYSDHNPVRLQVRLS